ncbi:MAG: PLP-dependent aminotransferase family protein [Proteobacteria bacterium]|nr:PLP-dependent aminotransferase family protein [Pseudomonadota bacterium]
MRRHARKAPPLGIALDPTRPDPLHRQIGEQLRRAILERRLAPGTRLPSSRLMAAELNCARGTVLLAVDQLIAEGYLVTQAGSGMSVAANLPDEMLVAPSVGDTPARRADSAPLLSRRAKALLVKGPAPQAPFADLAIAFPLGQPDRRAFPFPLWAKLLEQEWRRPAWDVAGAPHPFGHAGLRRAIADYLGMARGFACDPRTVVITPGARQSLSTVARIVLDAGEEAWIEEPGFRGTREALAWADVRAVAVPVDSSGFSLDAALALAPDARLAIVAPSHQFPLGTVLSLQRRLALLSWAERTGRWIVEDDFDGEYRYSGRPLAPLRALDRTDRVAYLGSFSKLLFPALRLSYLVLPEALVPAAEKIMAGIPDRASLLGQGALARFVADGHLGAHLRRTRLLYASRQQVLIEAVRRHLGGLLEVAPDPGGMHLIARPSADLAPVFDDVAATAAAAAASVSVAPLSECYSGAEKAQGLLLGYAGTPDEEIDPAVRKLGDALRALYGKATGTPA